MNGMLGDLIVESRSMDGVLDADAHMAKIQELAGNDIQGMSPTVHVPSLMYIELNGQLITHQATLVGIDELTYSSVSAFGDYLQHPANRKLNFPSPYATVATTPSTIRHQISTTVQPREQMKAAGWGYRRHKAMIKKQREELEKQIAAQNAPAEKTDSEGVANPFAAQAAANGEEQQGRDFDPAIETHPGIVLGIGTCSYRRCRRHRPLRGPARRRRAGQLPQSLVCPPEAISEFYTIVDFYESKMSEYDSSFMFVPLRQLQQSRGMIDPETGVGKFTSIQIKLRLGADAEAVRDKLRNSGHFPAQLYMVSTWRDKQGPLLAAVQMETAVLNVLLFMIIAVAGFGILAIFMMIVVEKTRDIGILKSLGASGQGVMGIFLGYGLALGIVGAGVGAILGIAFVIYINEIADLLGRLTGQPVFDPSVYYFYKIPTIVNPLTVAWICAGAAAIAVLASILPAWRAARLHPVRALRYE